MKVLVVDDEEAIRVLITFACKKANFLTEEAATALDAVNKARAGDIDIIILDLMLPDMSGSDVCRLLKADKSTCNIPIIMVTAKTSEIDIISGLNLGADDYVTKPFSPRVLVARIQSILRRKNSIDMVEENNSINASNINIDKSNIDNNSIIKRGRLTIDITRHKVLVEDIKLTKNMQLLNKNHAIKDVDLTSGEFNILLMLLRHIGRVFTREEIINTVKGSDYFVGQRSIDVQIVSLRHKLQQAGLNNVIKTVRSIGYCIEDNLE